MPCSRMIAMNTSPSITAIHKIVGLDRRKICKRQECSESGALANMVRIKEDLWKHPCGKNIAPDPAGRCLRKPVDAHISNAVTLA